MTTTADLLDSLYKDPKNPGSYGGVWPLFIEAKKIDVNIKIADVEKWLKTQDTYTLHKQAYRKFKRNKIYVGGIDHQWEIDLVDMQAHSHMNEKFKYMLTCIDSFSKFAWVAPLRDKTGQSIYEAFRNILEAKRIPYRVRSDKGKEFINHTFQKLLQDRGIEFFTSQNDDIKCAIVERFNRTLKGRMYRYFTEKKTRKWIDVLDQLVSGYNNSIHRSIKEKPINVTLNNEAEIRTTLYGKNKKQKQTTLDLGDYVRISIHRQVFAKGYLPQWSQEIFKIYKLLRRTTEPLYKIKDLKDEEIQGTFYAKELQKIHFDQDKTFNIESIIKRRKGPGGNIQLLVKWQGYSENFNEWINQDDLIK